MHLLILGPSSSGKTTFITNEIKKKGGKLSDHTIVFEGEIEQFFEHNKDCLNAYIHYNICRYLELKASKIYKKIRKIFINHVRFYDPVWDALISQKNNLNVIILITDKHTLINRVKKRTALEAHTDKKYKYPSSKWLKIYKRLDLQKRYKSVFRELDKHNINYSLIDSTSEKYNKIESVEAALEIINR